MSTRTKASNRGFWIVMLPMGAAGILLIVLIVLFRPRGGGEALVQSNLRRAVAAARQVRRDEGSFAGATALRLRLARPDLLFIDPDESSNHPDVISVFASTSLWAGAARSSSGACFWIRATADGTTTYGSGPDCTGEAARAASRPVWPAVGS
jgi:hypothetical protein